MANPSRYRPEYAEQGYKLCLLGATDKDLASFFQVGEVTIRNWKHAHPEFAAELARGKQAADAEVANRLFHRATGYSHPETKVFMHEGHPVLVETTKHYPPDTMAIMYWLNNRQKAAWQQRQQHEVTGKDGGPIETKNLTDVEIAREVAFLMASALRTSEQAPSAALPTPPQQQQQQ